MPPPLLLGAALPLTVQLRNVSVPALTSFQMPPPPSLPFAVLPVTTLSRSISVPPLKMPPPSPLLFPLVMVTPEMVTVFPLLMLKTRLLLLPLTVKRLAPGPVIVRFLLISSSPLVSVIVCTPGSTVIVSLSAASAIASRKLPGPLSLVLLTTGPGSPSATSTIVTVALANPRLVPVEGELRVKSNVSSLPFTLSSMIGTLIVFVTSPIAKITSPDVAV